MSRTHVHTSDVGLTPRGVTRRDALRLFMGAGLCATFFPAVAGAATTQEKLDAAQLDYDQAQAALDQIGQEYAQIAGQLSQTQAQIGDVNDQISQKQADIEQKQDDIEQTQADIDAREAQIESKQEQLGDRMSAAYKAGTQSTLDLILSSASFEELTSNIYYLDKVSEAERQIIEDVRALKEQLEQQKAELEGQQAELEQQQAELEDQRSELQSLASQQQDQLTQAQAKQDEAEDLVNNLSAEVQELMAQRDAELLAAQKAAEEARRQQEEWERQQREQAQQAQQAQQSGSGGGGGSTSTGSTQVTGSGSLSAVVSAAYSTPSPGSGLCAAWVSNVFRNAGIGSFGGNANNMYYWWCGYSTSQIQPGMIIAVNTAPYSAAAVIYGHVGIYVGNNTVRDNASGRLRTSSLSAWISEYSVTSTVRCGWLGGVALS